MPDNMRDPHAEEAAIERDVLRTQDEIGDTVQKLEEKMNPRDVTQSLIGDDNLETAKEALEVARRNPLPVALIAIGAVWLFATSDAPMIRELRERFTGGSSSRKPKGLRPRSAEPAPIGPPPETGVEYDRRPA